MERYDFAQNLAQEIGGYLKETFRAHHDVQRKPDGSIVTEVDTEAERRIREAIAHSFPEDAVLGEEGGGQSHPDGITWYVDPLDGTSNYALGLPLFAVSLAYADTKGLLGASIVIPMVDERYAAERGNGALLNGERIFMRKDAYQGKSLVFISHTSAVQDDERISRLMAMRPRLAMRIFGSMVVAFCWLASGKGDAGVFFGAHVWDYAAGMLIAQEAGGHIATPTGDAVQFPLRQDIIFAEKNHVEIVNELKKRIS